MKKRVREDLRSYLRPHVLWRRDLSRMLAVLEDSEAYVFGGLLGDLLRERTAATPRDVDIVVCEMSVSEIERRFDFGETRRNRFGGVAVKAGQWRFDIWPLENTWAFREGIIKGPSIEALPRTTFLNIEAIAVELFARAGRRSVYEAGCFAAWETGLLDINLEENPDPLRSALRAVFSAARYRFDLSARLTRYIVDNARTRSPAELESVEIRHFGRKRYGGKRLASWVAAIETQQAAAPGLPTTLPFLRHEQLTLHL